jgi:hypothetical protein
MSAADTAKTVAGGVFAGTVKGAKNGAKTSLYGSAIVSGIAAIGVAAAVSLLPFVGLTGVIVAGAATFLGGTVAGTYFSVIPATIGGSIIGAITRPFKELNSNAKEQRVGKEVALQGIKHETSQAVERNVQLKEQKAALQQRAAAYQVDNPLADGKAADHHQKQAQIRQLNPDLGKQQRA